MIVPAVKWVLTSPMDLPRPPPPAHRVAPERPQASRSRPGPYDPLHGAPPGSADGRGEVRKRWPGPDSTSNVVLAYAARRFPFAEFSRAAA